MYQGSAYKDEKRKISASKVIAENQDQKVRLTVPEWVFDDKAGTVSTLSFVNAHIGGLIGIVLRCPSNHSQLEKFKARKFCQHYAAHSPTLCCTFSS